MPFDVHCDLHYSFCKPKGVLRVQLKQSNLVDNGLPLIVSVIYFATSRWCHMTTNTIIPVLKGTGMLWQLANRCPRLKFTFFCCHLNFHTKSQAALQTYRSLVSSFVVCGTAPNSKDKSICCHNTYSLPIQRTVCRTEIETKKMTTCTCGQFFFLYSFNHPNSFNQP